jgi:hypothetical protein
VVFVIDADNVPGPRLSSGDVVIIVGQDLIGMPFFGCLPAVDDTGTFFPGSSGATGQGEKNNKKIQTGKTDRGWKAAPTIQLEILYQTQADSLLNSKDHAE